MPKAKKKTVEVVESEVEATPRDYVMARLAAGRAAANSAITAIDETLNLFVNPDEDDDGGERTELVAEALEALGVACRAVECAEKELANLDEEAVEAGEPWDESDEEDN